MTDTDDSTKVNEKLQGKTLAVYWVLLQLKKPLSLRDVQRKVGLSSPSLALYHLEKLKNLGLVEMERYGGYYVSKEVKTGFMKFFVSKGRFYFPRSLFYMMFFLSELLCLLLLFSLRLGTIEILLLLTLIFAISFSLYETIFVWRTRPIRNKELNE